MKYCSYCGTQMPDAARFCPKCGKAAMQNRTEPRPSVTEQAKNNIQIHPASCGTDNTHVGNKQKPIAFMNLSLTPAKIIKLALTIIVILLLLQVGLGFAHKGFLYEYTLKQAIAYHLTITRGYEEGESEAKVITLHSSYQVEEPRGYQTYVYSGMAQCNDPSVLGTYQSTLYYACVLQSCTYIEYDVYDVNPFTNEVYNYRDREDYKRRNPVLKFAELLYGINFMNTQVRDSEQQMQLLVNDIVDSETRDVSDFQAINSTKLNELLGKYDANSQPQSVEERVYKIFGTLKSIKQRNDGFVFWLDCSSAATDPENSFADTTVLVRIPYNMLNMDSVVYLSPGDPIVCCGYFDPYFENPTLSNCRVFVHFYPADDDEYYSDEQLDNCPLKDGIVFMLEHNMRVAQALADKEALKRYSEAYTTIQ